MTANEYLEFEKQKGNERVCKLIKFLQDNGYDYSEFDIAMIMSGQIRRETAKCRTPTNGGRDVR